MHILDLARNHKPPIEVQFIRYLVGKPHFDQQVSMKLQELTEHVVGPKAHHRNWKIPEANRTCWKLGSVDCRK